MRAGTLHNVSRVPVVYPISRMGTLHNVSFVAKKATSCTRRVPEILNGYIASHQQPADVPSVPALRKGTLEQGVGQGVRR